MREHDLNRQYAFKFCARGKVPQGFDNRSGLGAEFRATEGPIQPERRVDLLGEPLFPGTQVCPRRRGADVG